MDSERGGQGREERRVARVGVGEEETEGEEEPVEVCRLGQ